MASLLRLSQQHSCSFDHLVGELLKLQRHVEAKRLGRLEVDNDLEFRWMLHRQISGLRAPEQFIGVYSPLPELVSRIEPVGDQSALFGIKREWIDCGEPIACCQRDN